VSTARRGQAVWWDVAEKPGFEEYVHAHGATMVRLARLLTGDHDRAEDLVQDVLARAYPRWHLIVRADRPELYLRRMMVNLNASWWRRRANHRCTIPLRITVQPPGATVSGCTYDTFHSGETVNVEVAFRSASKRLTVSAQPYRSDLLGPSASPAVKTSHGFTYAQVENGSYTALLYAEGPFPVLVFTEGAYGKADAVQVMDGLVASGDPKDPTTWPQNPIG